MALKNVMLLALIIPNDAWVPRGIVRSLSERRSQLVDMDALIEELASTAPFDLPSKVSQEMVMRTVGRPQFFLRIAELCDQEVDANKRERYRALADNLSNTLSAVVERTESRLEDASQRLAAVVAAASEDDGEFLVPLSSEKRDALRAAVAAADVDEAMLSTINAATKKAEADGMSGVVTILRKVLQYYAANALAFDPTKANEDLSQLYFAPQDEETLQVHPDYVLAIEWYRQLMEVDAQDWDILLKRAFDPQTNDTPLEKSHLLAIIQAQIERVVLLQDNGSFKQRVQAEFLRELVVRVEENAPRRDDQLNTDDIVKSIVDEA